MSDPVQADSALFHHVPPHKFQGWLGLIKEGEPHVVRRALLAVAITWVPLAVLTAIHGDFVAEDAADSFLFDFGVHARFLVAAPLLILAEAICVPRLGTIARHFVDAGLIADKDRARFDDAVTSTRRLRDSTQVEIVAAVLAYAIVWFVVYVTPPSELPGWHGSAEGESFTISPAGWWGFLVSLPLLIILQLGWLWRVFLWARFLRLMSRLELRLVPAHPDHVAGLKFVGNSVQVLLPLGFITGVLAAGAIANRVVHEGATLFDYRYPIAGIVLFIVAVVTGPLLVFGKRLLEEKRRGMFQYGALAAGVGRQFERKWLERKGTVEDDALEVPDFSATTDLYQVVSNVYDMRTVPIDVRDVLLLVATTLLPFLPIVLMAVPFDVILKDVAGLLL